MAREGLDTLRHCDAGALALNPGMAPRLKHVRRLNPVRDDADDLWEPFGSVQKHLAAGCAGFADCLCSGVGSEVVDDRLALRLRLGHLEECEVRGRRFGNLSALQAVAGELKDWLACRFESDGAASARS